MRLQKIQVQNYRSIKNSGPIRIEPFQGFVGENNCGKSNLLRAIECFLSAGAGGMRERDFNDPAAVASIECEFGSLSAAERRSLRPYLLGDKVILRKEMTLVRDDVRNRSSVKAEYHGYQAEPTAQHLSIAKLEAAAEGRVKWKEIADQAGILEWVSEADGRITKASYQAGIQRYIAAHEVEYDQPVLGETMALGIPQNLLSVLPEFYLLPAITDYSDEVDRRSSSTVFRRLMADLSDRIMSADARFQELEAALARVNAFFNIVGGDGVPNRLQAISDVEDSLRDVVQKLMPSVQSISLEVAIEPSREVFAKGVNIRIDDGVLTDVLEKGHGMQRSFVFSLLQLLIKAGKNGATARPIILAVEEPELYIHPHCQRLIFRVLQEFVGVGDGEGFADGSDQVVYTTHSPAFIEIWNYERIGIVRKPSLADGTVIRQAPPGVLGSPADKKAFKVLTCFGLKHNEVFFARDAVLVEGPEDEVGVIATARKLGRIIDLPDEVGCSIIVTHGKGDIPKFQKVFNAFGLSYGVLLEMDGHDENHPQTAPILAELNGNRIARVPNRIENLLGVGGHFDDQRHAKLFFADVGNINKAMEALVTDLLPPQ